MAIVLLGYPVGCVGWLEIRSYWFIGDLDLRISKCEVDSGLRSVELHA